MAGAGPMTVGPMPLILDASVLVKLVVEEPGSNEAVALLDRPEPRMVPDWALIETANALWNKVKYSHLLEIHAEDSLNSLIDFIDHVIPARDLSEEALRLAFRLRHPVYDALYLALALREKGTVITADKDFVRAADRAGLGGHMELLVPA